MKRLVSLAAAAVLLAGCNVVMSNKPLLAPDQASGPQLRPGLWATSSPGCWFAAKAPAYRWPRCADWMLVRPGEILNLTQDKEAAWQSMPIVVAGEAVGPQIVQITEYDPDAKPGDPSVAYVYAGLRVLERDGEGRAVRVRMWVLDCGPEPPKDAVWPDGKRRYVTLQPYPGLRIEPGEDVCTPTDLASLTRVAGTVEGHKPAGEIGTMRWVRDGYP